MNKAKTAGKADKTPKAKTQRLKVKTNVKAGGIQNNRCEILRRKV